MGKKLLTILKAAIRSFRMDLVNGIAGNLD